MVWVAGFVFWLPLPLARFSESGAIILDRTFGCGAEAPFTCLAIVMVTITLLVEPHILVQASREIVYKWHYEKVSDRQWLAEKEQNFLNANTTRQRCKERKGDVESD